MRAYRQRAAGTLILAGLVAMVPGASAWSAPRTEAQPAAGDTARQAPEFEGIAGWLNGGPLTMRGLRGKVVLVDFWAYSCINCIRTLPHLIDWQKKYAAQGLVVVGVHTPEFRFETDPANIQRAITRFGIPYPVAEDNALGTWNAFRNRYWPAEYLVDRSGRIVYSHFGEGEYDRTETAIRTALGTGGTPLAADDGQDLSRIGSPEMYFGLARVANLASAQPPRPGVQDFAAPASLPMNRFALAGRWSLSPESAELVGPGGRITLHCHAARVFMVASAARPVTMQVRVDGGAPKPVTVGESRLYTLLDSDDAYRDRTVEIDVPASGLRAFTFTFG